MADRLRVNKLLKVASWVASAGEARRALGRHSRHPAALAACAAVLAFGDKLSHACNQPGGELSRLCLLSE